ncbi:uncharacterized protein LOC119174765 [Rhipicephalus microplus]|uniref:uncharacterized protein LOC119174765 n=1 Tax=Rhipicephalus microplus TaxID=6941 RepID=UPI001888B005|nr:uncharacterized protein LOC119174765 [Rhipicephalus microplus]
MKVGSAATVMGAAAPRLLSVWLALWLASGAEAVLLGMLLRRSTLGSMIPKPSIKIYRDLDNGHGSGLRSGFKVGIDATFGGSNSKEQKQEDDDALGDRYHHHQHDDYKLQQGDYDLHRYQKSPSITVEIRAREPPEPPTTEPPPPKGFSLRRIVKRRRKGRRTTTLPPLTLPPPPPPDMSLMPTYRKELMYPEYAFGPYKGHTLMGFTYDGQDFKS